MASFDQIDLDLVAQLQPWHVYRRLSLAVPRAWLLYTVPYGFNYLLRRVVSRWPSQRAGPIAVGPIYIEIYSQSSTRARTPFRLPLDVVSSPAQDSVIEVAFPAPPGGVSQTAAPLRSLKIVNLALPYGDTLRIEVTGGGFASFLDVVLQGYLIPESALAMWRDGGRDGEVSANG